MNSGKETAAEVVRKILSLLPGVDCGGLGGCGKKTCRECAESIAAGESVALCPACKQETVDAIATVMGVPSVEAKDQVAYVSAPEAPPAKNASRTARAAGRQWTPALSAANAGTAAWAWAHA